jgi:pyruvate,water dikinase
VSSLLRTLDQLDDETLVGAKARSLQHMRQLGFHTPDGRVLIPRALDLLTRGAPEEDIPALIDSAPLPPEVSRALVEARALGPGPYIVRSSAIGEDSADASFAGQLDTIFPVDPDDLESAVRACWRSLYGERAVAYQKMRGAQLAGIAVLIQPLVQSAFSGVLFTDGVALTAEVCQGFGEAVVSGRVTPLRFTIDRRAADGPRPGAARVRATTDELEELPLCDARVHELARAATELERRRGVALDIEWTVDDQDRLWLLQARPVTTAKSHLWSNANICENFPGPVTPLLYSVARAGYAQYFRSVARAMGFDEEVVRANHDAFEGVIGAHGARLYYDLTNIHALFRLAPFGDRLVEAFDLFVGAGDSDRAIQRPLVDELRALAKLLAHGARAFARLPRRIERFERRVTAFADRYAPDALPHLADVELAAGVEGFLEIRLRQWTDAALCDGAAMLSYGALKSLLERALPGAADESMHNALLKGLDGLASAAPIEALYEVAELVRAHGEESIPVKAAFAEYVETWGFRGSGELMLTEPSFQERPEQLWPILRRYVDADVASPSERLREQAADRLATTRDVRRQLPRAARPIFDAALKATQAAVGFRERARLKQALLYSRLRRIALVVGDRLARRGVIEARDDIFFFTYEELVHLLRGRAFFGGDAQTLVRARKEAHERLSALDLPDVFMLGEGETVSAADDDSEPLPLEPGELVGTAASSGQVSGRAAVLRGLDEADSLQPGDLLVTKQTDPGWAPLFFLIEGLVMERGGMLSHGSILAREFGIPSVVGVRDVTAQLEHGAHILVDGDAGRVRPVV